MLVLARKLREPGPLAAPQQSDYAQDEWVHGPAGAAAGADGSARRRTMVRTLARMGLVDGLRAARERWRAWRSSGLALPSPDYERVDVQRLVGRPRR
jgi:hypothetical protein